VTATPTQFSLSPLPLGPAGRAPLVRGAQRYLNATHESVAGLLDAFDAVRVKAAASKATLAGRLRRDQVDLLRAGLVFTSSGLDAVCHRLVHDTVLTLIERGGGAKAQFDEYLKDQLSQPRAPDGLVDAVTSPDPRTALIDRYIGAKTSSSF